MTSPLTMDNCDDSFEMNTTDVTKHLPTYKKGFTLALQQEEYTPDLIIPLTVIYLAIFIAGVLGNLATCLVIVKQKAMQTVTNYYLFSLAISDLILLICGLPFEIQKTMNPTTYPFGDSMCKKIVYIAEFSANATVLTITAFTVERYVEICHPLMKHNISNKSRVVRVIIAIWVIAIFSAVPLALQFGVVSFVENGNSVKTCTIKGVGFPKVFVTSSFVFFLTPMSIITVCYSLIGIQLRTLRVLQPVKRVSIDNIDRARQAQYKNGMSQRGVLRMLFAVALSFLICWAPFHVQRLVAIYGIRMDYPSDNFVMTYTVLTCLSGVLYFLSTAINPVLYSIMSKKFRDAFKRTLESWCEERPPRCQTYNTLLAAQRREQINTREAERARARRLPGFIAAEIHDAPPRAQRFNEREVRVVFESSSSHGFWSRGSRFGHNEPSHSVESRVTISNSSLREVDLELAGEELATYMHHARSRSVGLTLDTYV